MVKAKLKPQLCSFSIQRAWRASMSRKLSTEVPDENRSRHGWEETRTSEKLLNPVVTSDIFPVRLRKSESNGPPYGARWKSVSSDRRRHLIRCAVWIIKLSSVVFVEHEKKKNNKRMSICMNKKTNREESKQEGRGEGCFPPLSFGGGPQGSHWLRWMGGQLEPCPDP